MRRFIRKEVQVFDVVQYWPDKFNECKQFVEEGRTNYDHWAQHNRGIYRLEGDHMKFPTNDGGYRTAKMGDYLIKRPDGVWPYDREEFEAKYREVTR